VRFGIFVYLWFQKRKKGWLIYQPLLFPPEDPVPIFSQSIFGRVPGEGTGEFGICS